MSAVDLQQGFRIGEWQVEPRLARITRVRNGGAVRSLDPLQLRALLYLATHHGQFVELSDLGAAIAEGTSSEDVAAIVDRLRTSLDDRGEPANYVLAVAGRGYSLIRAVHALQPPVQGPQPVADGVAREQAAAKPGLLDSMRGNRLIRSAVGYIVASWAIVQVANNFFPALHVPLWGLTLVIVVLALGFPIAMVIVWARGAAGSAAAAGGNRFARVVRRHWRIALVPVVLAGVGIVGMQWWQWMQQSGWTRAPGASIAVLPLLDMSTGGDSGYLGDGLSEELSSRLAQLPGLRVAARTSAFAYRGQEVDVREIGSKLGVRYVLEGSVRRDGDRVRVTAQLIDAETGFHAWTESYDRDWRDLLKLQEEISRAITNELRLVLTPEQEQQLARPATTDPKAYDLYLAGLAQFRQSRGLQNLKLAGDSFRRALAADPQFARAHAGLCQVGIARYKLTLASEEMRGAEDSCRRALEIDASLLETELALADLYVVSGRHDQARIAYEQILERSPRNADALVGLGAALEGRRDIPAAEKSLREAIAVEPGYWGTHNALGNFLFRHGRSEEAARAYLRVTQLRPGNSSGFNNLGAALLTGGDLEGAVLAFENSARIEPNRSAYNNLGTTYYYQRRYAESIRMYDEATRLAVEDHNAWGGRADSLHWLPLSENMAAESYRRAVLLAEKALAVDANDASTWAQLSYYYQRIGDRERSLRYAERAAELGAQLPYVQVYLALAATDRDDPRLAIEHIRKAIELGYPPALIAAEPAFDPLRGDAAYRSIKALKRKPLR